MMEFIQRLFGMFSNKKSNTQRETPKDIILKPAKKKQITPMAEKVKKEPVVRHNLRSSDVKSPLGKRMTSIYTGTTYPLEKELSKFYGRPGDSDNMTRITLPYSMYLAWDPSKRIKSIKCHKKVAADLLGIFTKTLEVYGIEEIRRLHLDEYGGCYNKRKIRGGTRWSTHAWAISVDLYTTKNRLRWKYPRAHFSREDYLPFWKIVKDHGAYSLGVNRNYDWQHFQFAAR